MEFLHKTGGFVMEKVYYRGGGVKRAVWGGGERGVLVGKMRFLVDKTWVLVGKKRGVYGG